MTGLMPLITPATLPTVELIYSSDTADVDLFLAAGSPSTPIVLKVTVEASADIYASTTANYAMDANGMPAGSRLDLTVDGRICGERGLGVSGGNGTNNGSSGNPGGPALRLGCETNIDGSGSINGGGGGGGGGGGAVGSVSGGGGEGAPACVNQNHTGGTGGDGENYNTANTSGGNGGSGGGGFAGGGGSGGTFGNDGNAGGNGSTNIFQACDSGAISGAGGGNGGAAGKSIEVNGQTYTNDGVTLNGTAS